MTVSSTNRKAGPYYGNGVTAAFPFSFKVFAASDLLVVKTNLTTGVDTVLAATDYSVSLTADNTGGYSSGTVTLTAGALASGYTLTITSSILYTQNTDLTNNGGFYPKVISSALDRLTILCQQLLEQVSRSLKLSISTPPGVTPTLPAPIKNNMIAWNANGDGLQNLDPQALATIVAFGTANSDKFSGDGTTTQFVLSNNPGSLNNLDVSIGGVTQRPGIDYNWSAGTVITFTTAPATGTNNILVRYMQGLPQGYTTSDLVQYGSSNVKDALDAINLADYAALRSYIGSVKHVYVTGSTTSTPSGIAGDFVRDDSDTVSADNGGTVIVDNLNRRWKRQANSGVFVKSFGAKEDGTTDDTAAINAALATGADVHLTAGKSYLVAGQLNFTTQGQTIHFHGATLNIQTGINFNANNITVDLEGGAINGWLHVAQLRAQAATGQNILQVVDASQIKIGDVLYSSYGDNIANFPLAAGIAVTAVNYSTNTITLASNLTGTVPLPVGIYVGTFNWTSMFNTNACKNLKFKNGAIGNSPAYFFSSWRWQYADFLTNIPTIFCENINFGNTGYDMFIFAQTQVKFDHCNFGINYDVAKAFIAYLDGANIELNWCNIARGNYDPDFIAISDDGRSTWFKSTNGKIVANDCTFDGTNKLPASAYFNANSLHTIVFNSAGGTYNGTVGPNTTFFPGFNFTRCTFKNYTRSLLSTSLTADTANNVLGNAIFDECKIYTQPWQLMVVSGKTYAIGNFAFNNCDIFSSGNYACAQSSYPNYVCKFNNCSLNVTGSIPLFQNSELNDCNLVMSPVLWLDPTSRARDLVIDATSKVGSQYTYSNFPVKGSFIINNPTFANVAGTVSNVIPGSSSGSYGQSNDITIRSANGTLSYNLTKFSGNTYAWANIKEAWPGTFAGLYGDDWCLFGNGAEVTGIFGAKYKSSYGLLASTTAAASSGATTIVVNSVSYPSNQPVVGDFVFIQMADGTVFTTKIAAGYTTGSTTITLTTSLPAAVNSGAGVSFLRITQL